MNDIQDAVTLARDVDIATAISVTTAEADAAFADFERMRKYGTAEQYQAAERVLNEVRARLADLQRQRG